MEFSPSRISASREVRTRALRDCPTLPEDGQALIRHRIAVPLCMRRQREQYHKCHRCVYRGQPADFVPEFERRDPAPGDADRPAFAEVPGGQDFA